MSYSRFSTNRDRGRRVAPPDSANTPFPRIRSRSRAGSYKSASSTSSKDSKESVRDKSSRQSSANDSEYSRNDSATTTGSNLSEDTIDYRVRSPTTCQCSCHDRDGRRRSTSRDRQRSSSRDRRGSSSRDRRGSSSRDRRRSSSRDGRESGDSSNGRNNRHSDSGDDGDGRMPPININDKRATKSNKGSFFNRDASSRYRARSDSKTSQFRITSVESDRKRRDRPPFKYYGGGRSLSTGDLRGIKNDYDYAREGFLTPRFTSEYKARYEMKHGQRYTVGSDKVIRYIDPAGEHLLIPKDSSQLQRTVSDSDISSATHSRNNRNVKLEPIDRKSTANGNKGAAPPENKQWLPTKKPSANSLPPMEKTPAMPDTSRQASARSNDIPHPLGLNTPPRRNRQLYPM